MLAFFVFSMFALGSMLSREKKCTMTGEAHRSAWVGGIAPVSPYGLISN